VAGSGGGDAFACGVDAPACGDAAAESAFAAEITAAVAATSGNPNVDRRASLTRSRYTITTSPRLMPAASSPDAASKQARRACASGMDRHFNVGATGDVAGVCDATGPAIARAAAAPSKCSRNPACSSRRDQRLHRLSCVTAFHPQHGLGPIAHYAGSGLRIAAPIPGAVPRLVAVLPESDTNL